MLDKPCVKCYNAQVASREAEKSTVDAGKIQGSGEANQKKLEKT